MFQGSGELSLCCSSRTSATIRAFSGVSTRMARHRTAPPGYDMPPNLRLRHFNPRGESYPRAHWCICMFPNFKLLWGVLRACCQQLILPVPRFQFRGEAPPDSLTAKGANIPLPFFRCCNPVCSTERTRGIHPNSADAYYNITIQQAGLVTLEEADYRACLRLYLLESSVPCRTRRGRSGDYRSGSRSILQSGMHADGFIQLLR
jgi:hypothetical protein